MGPGTNIFMGPPSPLKTKPYTTRGPPHFRICAGGIRAKRKRESRGLGGHAPAHTPGFFKIEQMVQPGAFWGHIIIVVILGFYC